MYEMRADLAETSLVFTGRRSDAPGRQVDEFVREFAVTIVPFGLEWHRAADAFARFGCGRHRALLNFGGCVAYAIASVAGDSLLFVGSDFRHTAIHVALSRTAHCGASAAWPR